MTGQHAELGDQQGHRRRGTDPGHLLGHDRLGDHVGTGPPVLDRDAQCRQFELDAGVERLACGKVGVPIGLGGVGGDPVLGEPAERVTELAVRLGQVEIGTPSTQATGEIPHRTGTAHFKISGVRLVASRHERWPGAIIASKLRREGPAGPPTIRWGGSTSPVTTRRAGSAHNYPPRQAESRLP